MVRNLALCTTVGKREGRPSSSVYVRYASACRGATSRAPVFQTSQSLGLGRLRHDKLKHIGHELPDSINMTFPDNNDFALQLFGDRADPRLVGNQCTILL